MHSLLDERSCTRPRFDRAAKGNKKKCLFKHSFWKTNTSLYYHLELVLPEVVIIFCLKCSSHECMRINYKRSHFWLSRCIFCRQFLFNWAFCFGPLEYPWKNGRLVGKSEKVSVHFKVHIYFVTCNLIFGILMNLSWNFPTAEEDFWWSSVFFFLLHFLFKSTRKIQTNLCLASQICFVLFFVLLLFFFSFRIEGLLDSHINIKDRLFKRNRTYTVVQPFKP